MCFLVYAGVGRICTSLLLHGRCMNIKSDGTCTRLTGRNRWHLVDEKTRWYLHQVDGGKQMAWHQVDGKKMTLVLD